MQPISFTVWGKPATAGSKRAFAIRRKDGSLVTRANGSPVITVAPDNPRTKDFRHQIQAAAAAIYSGPSFTGPVYLKVMICFARPRSHFGSGRNSETLKPSAPRFHLQKPDSLKVVRAIEDALTGVLYRDDSQVVRHEIDKMWGEREFTTVEVGGVG